MTRTEEGTQETRRSSDLAVYSLIAAALAYTVLPLVGAVAAVILGHMGLGEIHRSGGRMEGRGMAMAGMVLGYIQIALSALAVVGGLLFVLLLVPVSTSSEVRVQSSPPVRVEDRRAVTAQEKSDMARITGALEAYRLDRGRYPETLRPLLSRPLDGKGGEGSYLDELPRDSEGKPYRYRALGRGAGFDLAPSWTPEKGEQSP